MAYSDFNLAKVKNDFGLTLDESRNLFVDTKPVLPSATLMSFIAETPKIITLKVPTLNDDKADFIRMFKLWQKIRGIDTPEVIFDFSACRFLRPNAVAFLGGLARFIQSCGGQATFAWDTLQADIRGKTLPKTVFYMPLENISKVG